ncbi:MAG: hypothetical protein ABIQ44_07195 [Chloroflexia bacterium]
MTGNFSTDIIVVYLPVLLAVVMGILGLLRGARREAVVSGSIVLAALIIIVWGVPWATDLSNIFTNFSVGDSRNVLSYIVMGLTVLVIGYMLGSAIVTRTHISAISRIGGLLLGIFNGFAIGGYFIKGAYDSASVSGNNSLADVLTTNNIARYLWIGANWFPLAIALIAALVALVGPFRRAQTTVATPAATTDWGPSTAPAATMAAPGPAAYTTGYGQGFTSQYPQQPAQPAQPQYSQPAQYGQQYNQQYGQSQAPTQAQPYVPSPAAQQYGQYTPPAYTPTPPVQPSTPAPVAVPVYVPPTSYTPAPPAPSRVEADDAPPTTLMPNADSSRSSSTPAGGQETLYIGSTSPKSSKDTDPDLKAPEWPGYTTEPSWLSPSTSSPSSNSSMSTSSSSSDLVPPALEDSSLVARSEAPTEAHPLFDPFPAPVEDASKNTPADDSSTSTSFVNCSRCGTLVPSDATFCTECGNRMKTA